MKLSYEAYKWLKAQISGMTTLVSRYFANNNLALEKLRVTEEELVWLRSHCPYLPDKYLDYLKSFRLYPEKQVTLEWNEDIQDVSVIMHGKWIETILYEIPILALVSEAYFRFVDTDWDYVGQYGMSLPIRLNGRTGLL
jgi:nicotinate phosphoribosyltransferase